MKSRATLVAGLLLAGSVSTACQPWGPMLVVGGVAGAASEVSASTSVEPADRPSLRKILSDGRYVFTAAPPVLERIIRRRLNRDAQARREVAKVVVRTATDGRTGWELYVVASVLSKATARHAEAWDGFLRGISGHGRFEVEEETMMGAEIAWMDVRGRSTLSLRYANDLFITILAPASTPRGHFDDLAKSLLRKR